MTHRIEYHSENYEDQSHHFGTAWANMARSLTDMRFNEALQQLDPPKYARALMREPMREWLADHMPPKRYSLRVEQSRLSDYSYERRAWIEFHRASDALLFRLTWG